MSEPWVKMKRGLFYRTGNCGYTGIRDLAGRYPRDEAEAEARMEGVSAMPLAQAPEFSPACFDDLARDHQQSKVEALRKQIRDAGEEPCA